jgi:hypothetical protein
MSGGASIYFVTSDPPWHGRSALTQNISVMPLLSFKDLERDGGNQLAVNYDAFIGAFTPQAI